MMSSVALDEICQVRENNPDDAIIIILGVLYGC